MRHLQVLSAVVAAAFGIHAAVADSLTIDVYPSLAPNAFGSPSWAGYMANAQTGLQNGGATEGDRNTNPTGYQVVSSISANQPLVTSYPSWDGVANPAFPFDNELGNRLHFGLVIKSSTAFSLSQISFEYSSSDPGDSLGFSGNLGGTNFSSGARYGLYYGADGVKGGVDDVVYYQTSLGNDATLINELYYVGVGNGFWPGGTDPVPSNPLLGRQGAIDDTAAWVSANVQSITATYTLNAGATVLGSSSATVAVTPVPLPASVGVGFAMLTSFGIMFAARKRLSGRPGIA